MPFFSRAPLVATICLLICSNIFMTIAWYGHLKHTKSPVIIAILVSWGIALFEYCFQVPGNRIGYTTLNLTQLKILQEVITLVVFTVFALLVFDQRLKWNYIVSYLLIIAAVYFAFKA
ncbi:MAG: DMT family protein [Candidatus Eremiobacteraeota bacterium]|nr:DMT family protein [Candidatus Eremiobacteraeota bacterium]